MILKDQNEGNLDFFFKSFLLSHKCSVWYITVFIVKGSTFFVTSSDMKCMLILKAQSLKQVRKY